MKTLLLISILFLYGCVETNSQNKHSEIEARFNTQTQSCTKLVAFNGKDFVPCTDFKGQSLSNIDLSNVNLQGSDFSNAILKDINFTKSKLQGVKFFKSQISHSIFNNANLDSVKFIKSKLETSLLVQMEGKNILIDQSMITNNNFSQSKMENSVIIDSEIYNSYFGDVDFNNSNWEAVSMDGCNLKNSNLYKNKFQNVDFAPGLNEYYQNMPNSQMPELNIFANADMRESIIESSNFNLNDLSRTKMQKSKVFRSFFQGANLEESILTYAVLSQNNFSSIVKNVVPENQIIHYIKDEQGFNILKHQTNLNYIQANNTYLEYSQFNNVSLSNGNWIQSKFTYSSFNQSTMDNNEFQEVSLYQASFYNNSMKNNNFSRSNLGVEQYRGGYPRKPYSVEFVECNLSSSIFDMSLMYFQDIFTNENVGPNFNNSSLKNSYWNYSDIRYGNLKMSNLESSNLEEALIEGVMFSSQTILPFNHLKANELGMLLIEE